MGLTHHWVLLHSEDVGQSRDLLFSSAGKGPKGACQP